MCHQLLFRVTAVDRQALKSDDGQIGYDGRAMAGDWDHVPSK